jgi:hypothetical protein
MRVKSVKCQFDLLWDGNHNLQVRLVKNVWSGKVHGLCGNCDGNAKTDMMTKEGKKSSSWIEIGNSYAVPGTYSGSKLTKKTSIHHCSSKVSVAMEKVEVEEKKKPACTPKWHSRIQRYNYCGEMKFAKSQFATCLKHLAVEYRETMFKECVFDACAVSAQGEKRIRAVLCDYYAQLAGRCEEDGRPVSNSWRHKLGCAVPQCGKNMEFVSQISPCTATCDNPNPEQSGCMDLVQIEGCQCKKGFLRYGEDCVSPTKCPPKKEINVVTPEVDLSRILVENYIIRISYFLKVYTTTDGQKIVCNANQKIVSITETITDEVQTEIVITNKMKIVVTETQIIYEMSNGRLIIILNPNQFLSRNNKNELEVINSRTGIIPKQISVIETTEFTIRCSKLVQIVITTTETNKEYANRKIIIPVGKKIYKITDKVDTTGQKVIHLIGGFFILINVKSEVHYRLGKKVYIILEKKEMRHLTRYVTITENRKITGTITKESKLTGPIVGSEQTEIYKFFNMKLVITKELALIQLIDHSYILVPISQRVTSGAALKGESVSQVFTCICGSKIYIKTGQKVVSPVTYLKLKIVLNPKQSWKIDAGGALTIYTPKLKCVLPANKIVVENKQGIKVVIPDNIRTLEVSKTNIKLKPTERFLELIDGRKIVIDSTYKVFTTSSGLMIILRNGERVGFAKGTNVLTIHKEGEKIVESKPSTSAKVTVKIVKTSSGKQVSTRQQLIEITGGATFLSSSSRTSTSGESGRNFVTEIKSSSRNGLFSSKTIKYEKTFVSTYQKTVRTSHSSSSSSSSSSMSFHVSGK